MEWPGDNLQGNCPTDIFLTGVFGELDIQQVLHDTEEKLKLNAWCIDQSLKEMQMEMNDVCTGDMLPFTADSLQWLCPNHLNSFRPLSTGYDELVDFLRALQNFLKTEQSQEETVLHLLLDISCQCGVYFPSKPTGSSFPMTSTASLHAVGDESSLQVQSVWDDIKLHLRRFIVEKLSSSQQADQQPDQRVTFKIHCLQQLLFLYPEEEVLSRFQNIQSKYLQDFLHELLCSSPGETGFDKVVHAYESAIPSVCNMVKEDLHTLNGIVEPALTIKFLNDVYHFTTTNELSAQIEKFCELQLKDSKLVAVKAGKISSKMKGAANAAASGDHTKKGRNFFPLTSHQLRCISQLMKNLICLENKIEELASVCILIKEQEVVYSIKGIHKKTFENTDGTPPEDSKLCSERVQRKESLALTFNWRSTFKDLCPAIVHCLRVVMEDVYTKALRQEETIHLSGSPLMISVKNVQQEEQIFSLIKENKTPKRIAKFCADIMKELDTFLALALAWREDSLQEIRADFVEVCTKVTTAIETRLKERSKEIPWKAPAQNLHVLLSTAIYIHQRVTHYEALLKDNSHKPLFLLPIQQYQELICALEAQVIDYNTRTCATYILQDPESHYWSDHKSFYEGEKCSFSILMWHYLLMGLRHDLWTTLPSSLAQEILAQVLSETLEILVQRYSVACPTYRRTLQVRSDITAILLCIENHLWSICNSTEALLQSTEDQFSWIVSIHNHCNQLLAVLAIVTSPLQELHEALQNVSSEGSVLSTLQIPSCHLLQWLSFIKPTLFSQESLGMSAADEIAAQRQLKMLLSQPGCNQNLLLQTLLQHNCLVLRKLLNNSDFLITEGESDPANNFQDQTLLMEAIFMLLISPYLPPKFLCVVIEEYFDKKKLWESFSDLSDVSQPELEVMSCLRMAVIRPITTVVNKLISMVHAWQDCENHGIYQHKQMVPEYLLSRIPKEWNYVPWEIKRKESGKSFKKLVAEAIVFIISNMPCLVSSLPAAVRYLFYVAEKRLSKISKHFNFYGLLVHNIVALHCHMLEDGNRTEQFTGATLDRWSKEKLALVSDCLQSIVGQLKESPKPVVLKIIQYIETQRPKWIESQLQKAKMLCGESAFESNESCVSHEESTALELTEQKIGMIVLDICHKPGGSEYLRQIYHIIQLNEEFVKAQLSAIEDSKVKPPQRHLKISLKDSDLQLTAFNPLKEFSHIGSDKFDQPAITEWDWEWPKLLPSYLGLSQVTLRALLANRWEMQDSAALEEKEKTLVASLKKLCFGKPAAAQAFTTQEQS
ncbi:uncharacterized protein KIAA0825 homolog isoform X1 [Erpetoichthys calabaricus]|nr:uncharacterized protein KIAA0825 homolog isoform X1 [Erpetoichthys calabaricus]